MSLLPETTTRQTYPTRRQSRKMPSLQGNWYEARSTAKTSATSASVMGRMPISGATSSSSGAIAIVGSCRQLPKHATRELQVLPRLALVRRVAQEIGGMIRHHEGCVQLAELVHPATQPAQRLLRGQQVLGRYPPHREQ